MRARSPAAQTFFIGRIDTAVEKLIEARLDRARDDLGRLAFLFPVHATLGRVVVVFFARILPRDWELPIAR